MVRRPLPILLTGLAALLSACGGSPTLSDTAAEPSQSEAAITAASGGPGVMADCQKLSEEPKAITVACGDGNFVIADITWDSWGQDEAGGTGTAEVNLCDPNCAEGKVGKYISGVTLSGIGVCDGKPAYTEIEVDFQDEAPRGYDDPFKQSLAC